MQEACAELASENSRGGGPERGWSGRGEKVLRWVLALLSPSLCGEHAALPVREPLPRPGWGMGTREPLELLGLSWGAGPGVEVRASLGDPQGPCSSRPLCRQQRPWFSAGSG